MFLFPFSVHCQQQRFRVRPSNVSVVEGDNAILRCEVQHQVGQLQWAKDGFALGKISLTEFNHLDTYAAIICNIFHLRVF